MSVCNQCSSFGSVIRRPRTINKQVVERKEAPVELLVPDFGTIIKNAREKRNLTQEEMAHKIQLKTSLLQNIEREHTKPSFKIGKSIEKFLNQRLYETQKEEEITSNKSSEDSLTIGDLISK